MGVCYNICIYLFVPKGSFRKTDIKGYVRMKNKVCCLLAPTHYTLLRMSIATDRLLTTSNFPLPSPTSDGFIVRVQLPSTIALIEPLDMDRV